MIRPAEHFVHNGVAIVPGWACDLLDQRLKLKEFRAKVRGENTQFDQVLVAIRLAALEWRASATGSTEPATPEPVASSDQWVTTTIAAGLLGILDRAVRLAIKNDRLPAENQHGRWLIARKDIEHYRASRAA